MRFKTALGVSLIFHFTIFAIVIYSPVPDTGGETTYYVDLVQFPSGMPGAGWGGPGEKGTGKSDGGNSDGDGASLVEQPTGDIKDLTVKKEVKSKLRYPDKEGRKRAEPREMISVVRKPREKENSDKERSDSRSQTDSSGVLTTGISSPGGRGGFPGGSGDGFGRGGFSFPYAYYIDMLRRRISSSWYNSLVSPGLRGKFHSVVYFRILRNGSVKDVKLEKKSGIDTLDLSALRAVENASPFAPLPPDFSSDHLIVHFKFEWEK